MMEIKKHNKFEGVYWAEEKEGKTRLATKNLAPDKKVYDERLVKSNDEQYRIWNPYRSKLASVIFKKIKSVPIKTNSKVLYLGAASGTTASHISDIVGENGMIYCVEVSTRPVKDLLVTCENRPNMAPILADAEKPDQYRTMTEQVDIIYQDVAHPNQTEILLKNSETFLKEDGKALVALKARSIDVTKEPKEIFRSEIEKLEEKMEIIDSKLLEPYEEDHSMIILRKK